MRNTGFFDQRLLFVLKTQRGVGVRTAKMKRRLRLTTEQRLPFVALAVLVCVICFVANAAPHWLADHLTEPRRAAPVAAPSLPAVLRDVVVESRLGVRTFVWPQAIHWAADLPTVYVSVTSPPSAQQVCVFNHAPRQRSLFSRNTLGLFGTVRYVALEYTRCQFESACSGDSNAHPECDARVMPTVGIARWTKSKKCCFQERFQRLLAKQAWDVAVVSGDEFCLSRDLVANHSQYRFYADKADVQTRYLPLGPREEFAVVQKHEVVLSDQRAYLFSFMGSITHPSRASIADLVTATRLPSFMHIVRNWSQEITSTSGYLSALQYRAVLLNSSFALCPSGYNPESFRVYEACEAGAIPVLVLDEAVYNHTCPDAFDPFIKSGAPFVFLRDWSQASNVLAALAAQPMLMRAMQVLFAQRVSCVN